MPPHRFSIDPGKADPKGFFANRVLQLQENPIINVEIDCKGNL